MFCSREYQLTSRLNQQNEKLTSNYTTRVWVRGAALGQRLGKTLAEDFRLQKSQDLHLCIHKDLVPVSIKLKTTIKTDKAKKIIKYAEETFFSLESKL